MTKSLRRGDRCFLAGCFGNVMEAVFRGRVETGGYPVVWVRGVLGGAEFLWDADLIFACYEDAMNCHRALSADDEEEPIDDLELGEGD